MDRTGFDGYLRDSGLSGLAPSDGLTSADVEALVAEAELVWARSVVPTTALLDGSAALRRERREARRAFGAVVRALPARPRHATPEGEVA